MFAWSISFAQRVMPECKIILSTDFEPLIDCQHEVSNLQIVGRSKSVSSSQASTEDWLLSLIGEGFLANNTVALLQPTSPFRAKQTFVELLRKYRGQPEVTHYSGHDGKPNGNLYLFDTNQVGRGVPIVSTDSVWLNPSFEWENIDIDDASDWSNAEGFLDYPDVQSMQSYLRNSMVGSVFQALER